MADLSQLEAALVKADGAGDADGARVLAGEIRRIRAAPTEAPPVMQQLPTMRESIRQQLGGAMDWEKNLAGMGTAAQDTYLRLKQLTGNELSPQNVADVRSNRDMNAESGQVQAGNIAGNLAMTAVPGAGLYRGATALAGRVLPAALAPTLAPTVGGAVTGAATAGVTQPVLPGESTAQNMGYGAAGGAVGDTGARVASRLAQPIMQSPAVQALLQHGVVPTPGQSAGPNSFGGRLEQRAQSVLGVGDVITGGRNRVGTEFNRAAINQGVPEGQGAIRQIGNEGVDQIADISGRNYSRLLMGKNVVPDEELRSAISSAKDSPMLPLSAEGGKQFDAIVSKLIWSRIPESGPVPANKIKAEVIGDLGKAAQKYFKVGNSAEQNAIGEALMNARDSVQSWMLKAAGVSAKDIATADTAYAAQKTVEKAARAAEGRAGARGEFSPLQLLKASRPGSASERLAGAGQDVLPGTVPNSGTIDRATLAALILGGGAEASHKYLGTPQYLTALAAAPLLYSRAGSRYAIGDLIPGQQATAAALRAGAPYAAQAGSLVELQRRQAQQ